MALLLAIYLTQKPCSIPRQGFFFPKIAYFRKRYTINMLNGIIRYHFTEIARKGFEITG